MRNLERNRCEGCGRFHQELYHYESEDGGSDYEGAALCYRCVDRENKREDARACTCPADARGWWDCLDCPAHGAAAAAAGDEQHRDEMAAENGWLRAAENAMENCPEWAR